MVCDDDRSIDEPRDRAVLDVEVLRPEERYLEAQCQSQQVHASEEVEMGGVVAFQHLEMEVWCPLW